MPACPGTSSQHHLPAGALLSIAPPLSATSLISACRWKQSGDHRYRYALVVTSEPLGRQLGYFRLGDPLQLLVPAGSPAGQEAQHGNLSSLRAAAGGRRKGLLQAAAPPSRPAAAGAVGGGPSHGPVLLNTAGYPDDGPNGTLWVDHCHAVLDWRLGEGAYLVHGCATRGGSSGSPLWAYDSRDGSRAAVALHVAGEVVQRRSGDAELHLAVPFTGEALQWR
jgi:hypothetical protein